MMNEESKVNLESQNSWDEADLAELLGGAEESN